MITRIILATHCILPYLWSLSVLNLLCCWIQMNFGWESKCEKLCNSLSNLSPTPPPSPLSMQVIPLFIFPLNFLLEISRMDDWAGAVNVTRPQWPAVWIWRCTTAFLSLVLLALASRLKMQAFLFFLVCTKGESWSHIYLAETVETRV